MLHTFFSVGLTDVYGIAVCLYYLLTRFILIKRLQVT